MDSPQRVATKPVKRDGDSESGSPHSATFARIAALKQSGFGRVRPAKGLLQTSFAIA